MDSHFKVPSIPLVASNLVPTSRKPDTKRKTSVKSSAVPKVAQPVQNKNHVKQDTSSASKSQEPTTPSSVALDLFPRRSLPKLCPTCSQLLVEYLAPIEAYIKQIITLTDSRGVHDSNVTPVTFNTQNRFESLEYSKDAQEATQNGTREASNLTMENVQNGLRQVEGAVHKQTGSNKFTSSEQELHFDKVPMGATSDYHDQVSSQQNYSESHSSDSSQNNLHTHSHNTEKVYFPPNVREQERGSQTNASQQWHAHSGDKESNHGDKSQWHPDNSAQSQQQNVLHTDENVNSTQMVHSTGGAPQSMQDAAQETQGHRKQPSGPPYEHRAELQAQNVPVAIDQSRGHEPSHGSEVRPWEGTTAASESHSAAHRVEETSEEVQSESCPYAYVTIAFNNLSAVNAILLCNSIQLYNNQVLTILQNNDSLSKKITTRYYIPTVILLYDSINSELRNIIYQLFDKVIESKYQEAFLLNDESLGIQQYKIHLWKELAFQYEKCVFLDSFTIVVGQVSNMFLDCWELSAPVDVCFPDNFDCSVFVFEPSMDTFRELLNYGLQLKLAIEDSFDTLDEMTLLNKFFAAKWKKLSFIYNFVRNDLSYTQVPAYFKYGGNIRVVNFGNIVTQHEQMSSSLQPWNYKFDLNKAQLEEEPFECAPVDSYTKLYLRCFIRRVWPLLTQTLTPLLLSRHNGRTLWTIFELVQVLSRVDGTESTGFEQNPVTLRRKKSWVMAPTPADQSVPEAQAATSPNDVAKDEEVSHEHGEVPPRQQDEDEKEQAKGASSSVSGQRRAQSSEKTRKDWEEGKVDWMGPQRSDNIIDRLMTKF